MIERFIEKFNSWDIQSNLHNSSTFRKVSDFHYEEKKKIIEWYKKSQFRKKKMYDIWRFVIILF